MLKALFIKDEIEQQAKKGGSSLDKFEKIIKKEVLDQEKPINPKYIFNDYKKSKADKKYPGINRVIDDQRLIKVNHTANQNQKPTV